MKHLKEFKVFENTTVYVTGHRSHSENGVNRQVSNHQWCWYCDDEIKTPLFSYDDDDKPVHNSCWQELTEIKIKFPIAYKKLIRDMKKYPDYHPYKKRITT